MVPVIFVRQIMGSIQEQKSDVSYGWGHEFAGTVVDMGSDVKEFEVGEMVGIGYDNCGE